MNFVSPISSRLRNRYSRKDEMEEDVSNTDIDDVHEEMNSKISDSMVDLRRAVNHDMALQNKAMKEELHNMSLLIKQLASCMVSPKKRQHPDDIESGGSATKMPNIADDSHNWIEVPLSLIELGDDMQREIDNLGL